MIDVRILFWLNILKIISVCCLDFIYTFLFIRIPRYIQYGYIFVAHSG